MERKLVSIQQITNIEPIKWADRIEKANILGFQVVVPKGMYSKNEPVVFFQADSFLPIEDRYSFLEKSSYVNDAFLGPGYRIKVSKLKGVVTEGLVMSLEDFPELNDMSVIGADITDVLGVRKWERPESMTDLGTIKGAKPSFVRTTDEIRLQEDTALLDELRGKPYYISTKIDGTSVSIACVNREIFATTRKMNIVDDGKSRIWKYIHDKKVDENVLEYCIENSVDLIVQGELAGPKIQNNRLRLNKDEWFVFNVFSYDSKLRELKLLGLDESMTVAAELGVRFVPLEDIGQNFNYSFEELKEKAGGLYSSGQEKEGIVVRPMTPFYSEKLGKEFSFKVLNDDSWGKE